MFESECYNEPLFVCQNWLKLSLTRKITMGILLQGEQSWPQLKSDLLELAKTNPLIRAVMATA